VRTSILLSALVLASAPAVAQTTFSSVHPIYQAHCTPCHVNQGSGGHNMASPSITTAYSNSQLISYHVPGQTKGFATLVRIQNGTMPQGAGCSGDPTADAGNPACLDAPEQALIQARIDDGQQPPSDGTSYCFGDGTGTPCPCGNSGASGRGCANSVVASGGRVIAVGAPSVANDTVVLRGFGMPNSSALYFQGTSQAAAGAGTTFGDGLRCVAGSVIRLGTKTDATNASRYPEPGDLSVSVRGAIPGAGRTRHYQVWYRNAAAYCTADTFNLTNGVTVAWTPGSPRSSNQRRGPLGARAPTPPARPHFRTAPSRLRPSRPAQEDRAPAAARAPGDGPPARIGEHGRRRIAWVGAREPHPTRCGRGATSS
jgi:hypothetical protein